MKRLAVLLVLAVLPLAACTGGGGDRAFHLEVSGRASIDGRAVGAGDHDVVPGDDIVVRTGSARLELPGDGWIELRQGSQLRVAATPTLVGGDALVSAAAVRAGAARAAVEGLARVRRSSGASLGVYRGRARVVALGRALPVPVRALRQVSVADTGALPRRPVPLSLDRRHPDPWDLRYLGDAIDLGDQLQRRSRALDRQLGVAVPVTPPLLRRVLPPLRTAPAFRDDLVDGGRAVGETLVGASIALAGQGPLPDRWHDTFAFRSQGADWGLVALDQRAQRADVVGVLDGVLDRTPPSVTTPTTRPTGTTTTTSPGPGTQQPPPTTPPTTPPPTRPTIPTLPVDPLGGLTPIIDGLLGSAGGLLTPG
jgi:hypothetical protein